MRKALFDDDEGYTNEEGLYVFTEHYLLQRGYCCGNGCLHCPYQYKNVTDPVKKEALIKARNIRDEADSSKD